MGKKDQKGLRKEKRSSQRSWRDIYEEYEDVPDRLGGQRGYRLYGYSLNPTIFPYPRLKPGVNLILEELEKSHQDRNTSNIAAGMAMMDEQLLKKLPGLPDNASRMALLEAYDPRFAFLSEDLLTDFLELLANYNINMQFDTVRDPSENLQPIVKPSESQSTPRGPGRPRTDRTKKMISESVEKHPEWRIDERLREVPSKGEKFRALRDDLSQKVFFQGWILQNKTTSEWLRGRWALLSRHDKKLNKNSQKKD